MATAPAAAPARRKRARRCYDPSTARLHPHALPDCTHVSRFIKGTSTLTFVMLLLAIALALLTSPQLRDRFPSVLSRPFLSSLSLSLSFYLSLSLSLSRSVSASACLSVCGVCVRARRVSVFDLCDV